MGLIRRRKPPALTELRLRQGPQPHQQRKGPRPQTPPRAPGSPETDREALVALYNATDGWGFYTGLLSDVPLGEWPGVSTDAASRVRSLSLYGLELSGEIPPELGDLGALEELNLDKNQLSGGIPPELGNLANLEELTLHDNQLSGEIPPELGNLAKLEYLYLAGNHLSGCVPGSLQDQLKTDISDLGDLPFC